MQSNNLADSSNGSSKSQSNEKNSEQEAVAMLRQKISNIYGSEPDAKEELVEAEAAGKHRSKHQKYMHDLSTSGKSLAEIQTAWHNYYVDLPDDEKHAVWQEFYSEHSDGQNFKATRNHPAATKVSEAPVGHVNEPAAHGDGDPRNAADIKQQLLGKVKRKTSKKAHFHSLAFGLGVGIFSLVLLLFGFFNERFLAPFISPSKNVSNTPIVIDPSSSTVGAEPKIIIPKINLEIPVVYDQPSVAEKDIQASLEEGVVHYATTPNPGEKGNGVIFGHSSNNILNKGKYKFAFVLLKQLEIGDTFYLQKDGKRYVYKVGEKKVVKPTDVSILYADSPNSTMTLITCDPPGTSLNRLLVIGQQVSPDPATNVASTASKDASQPPAVIPSNAPSLWERFTNWITS